MIPIQTSLLAMVFAVLLTTGCRQQSADSSLATALTGYLQDLRERGDGLPESLTLSTLIELGYLPASASNTFGAITVEFYPEATETYPQHMMMAAVMPDGSAVVAMGDGSVQQLSPTRYKLQKEEQTGQPVAPHEPPPRVSVPGAPDDRTLDSLPAPGSSGGR